MRDTIGLTLLKLGKDPGTATNDDCDAAIAEIKKTVDSGVVRSFLGNDYKEGLIKGDLVLGTAWSGDVIQAQLEKASLKFNIPSEGGMIWTDNMLIPKGAAHKYTAELMIDYVYDPEIAAQIAAYVQYVSPVKGAKEAIAKNRGQGRGRPGQQSADVPGCRDAGEDPHLQGAQRGRGQVLQQPVLHSAGELSRVHRGARQPIRPAARPPASSRSMLGGRR